MQKISKKTKKRSLLVNLTKNGNFKNYFKLCKPALKSLLKAFLPLPEKSSIQKVTLLDSFLPFMKEEDKSAIMDLRLQLNTGELVNVEMQAFFHKGFSERVLFYWAKNYISQLKEGEEYTKLVPSYSLIFSAFDLFPGREGFYNSFDIRSRKPPHFPFNKDLCFVTVELNKFRQDDVSSSIDFQELWCYILKKSNSMKNKDYQKLLDKDSEWKEAMMYLRKFSLEEQQQIIADAKEKNRRDRVAREAYVFDEGKAEGEAKGRAEGRAEGKAEGRAEGKAEGEAKERIKLITSMLKNGANMDFIAKCTGLSIEEISKLKKGE